MRPYHLVPFTPVRRQSSVVDSALLDDSGVNRYGTGLQSVIACGVFAGS